MKKAIIIHGRPDPEEVTDPNIPSPSNAHWLPWLQKRLCMEGYDVQTPEMPNAHEPRYAVWRGALERLGPDKDTVLVGHSTGAGCIVRWLSENNVNVDKVVLVAPWIDPHHTERDNIGDFFDFEIDSSISGRTNGISMFISSDDDQPMLDTAEILETTIDDLHTKRFENKGHFTAGDGVSEFPELLEEILK